MADLPASAEVIVVGGGVIGLAIARALADAGATPLVLEAQAFGGAVTGGSLAAIGTHMHGIEEFALMRYACDLWRDLADRTDTPFEYNSQGQIGFFQSETDIAAGKSWVDSERTLGADCRMLDPQELRTLEPNLTGPVQGGTWAPDTATVNPFLGVRTLLRQARAMGAAAFDHTRVDGLETAGGKITAVTLAQGQRIETKHVVLACGPWSARLAVGLGLSLPLNPRQAQCLASVRQPPQTLRRVITACEASGGVTSGYTQIQQSRNGQILFNTVTQPADAPKDAPDRVHEAPAGFVRDSIDMLTRLFPGFKELPLLRSWVRFEAVSPDHRFLAGALPVEGLYLCAGDNGSGYCRALMLGRYLAQTILQQPLMPDDLSRDAARLYKPARFRLEAAA